MRVALPNIKDTKNKKLGIETGQKDKETTYLVPYNIVFHS
jgi:hypothetical protein